MRSPESGEETMNEGEVQHGHGIQNVGIDVKQTYGPGVSGGSSSPQYERFPLWSLRRDPSVRSHDK